MKLGWIGKNGTNQLIERKPLAETSFSTGPGGMYYKLYPNEDSANIDIFDPDYDLLNYMDAVIYMSGSKRDAVLAGIIDRIPCKVLSYHEGGEHDFLARTLPGILNNRDAMNKSDLVLVWDTRALGLHRLYTTTKVLWWPLPYPVEQISSALASVNDVMEFDIVVSYSPVLSQGSPRNGIAGCLLAQHLLDTIEYYKTATVFSYASIDATPEQVAKKARKVYGDDVNFLKAIGCQNIYVMPRISSEEYLAILSKAKLVINLDRRRASGRMSLECAYVRTPVIATDQQPNSFQVYNGIRLHDIFDIDSMVDTATLVAEGRWRKEWFDLAYERAQHFSYTKKARVLEREVMAL